jgi:alpha-L-fucosidase
MPWNWAGRRRPRPSSAPYGTALAAGAEKVEAVSLLGSGARISFEQQADGLHLQLPERPQEKYAYGFRIVLAAGAPPAK